MEGSKSLLLCCQGQVPSKVTLKRFYRPEDISIDAAYKAELYEVYSCDEKRCVDVDSLVGRCLVGLEAGMPGQSVREVFVVWDAFVQAQPHDQNTMLTCCW